MKGTNPYFIGNNEKDFKNCDVCGKPFYFHGYTEYSYKLDAFTGEDGGPGTRFFCSYHCMREWEKKWRPVRPKPWMLDRKGQIKRLRELRDMLEGTIPMDGRKKEIKEDIHDLEYWLGINPKA